MFPLMVPFNMNQEMAPLEFDYVAIQLNTLLIH